jgi:hypothetical protein
MMTQVCLQRPRDGGGFELITRVVVDLDPVHKAEFGCGGYRVKIPAALGIQKGHLLINYGGVYQVETVTPCEDPTYNLYLVLRDDTVFRREPPERNP